MREMCDTSRNCELDETFLSSYQEVCNDSGAVVMVDAADGGWGWEN
jgi:hypothetical protein